MPMDSLELDRASQTLSELRRRLNGAKAETIDDVQREILMLSEVVSAMLHVLDRTVAEAKRKRA